MLLLLLYSLCISTPSPSRAGVPRTRHVQVPRRMSGKDNLGLSFADTTALDKDRRHPARVDVAALPPAGVCCARPANKSPASLTSSGSSKVTSRTEARAQYKPPPAGSIRQKPVKPPPSQLPKPNYPPQFESVTRADFKPDALQQLGPRSKAAKPADSGSPLAPVLDKPDFHTHSATAYKVHSKDAYQAANSKSAGHPATQIVKYNIIHGAPVGALNPHDAWTAGHDYKRKKY